MKNLRWIACQRATATAGRAKWIAYGAMMLVSLLSPGPSAQGASATLAPEQILVRMERQSEQQMQALESYQARRRYSVSHALLGSSTYLLVEERYSASAEKQFRVLERSGSSVVADRLFLPLLEAEQDTARGARRQAVELCRRNYRFTYLELDDARQAYVFQAEPLTSNPHLFHGKVWVNAQDFGVQRIEGQLAQRPSSLVRRTHFVHEFARFGAFWFPVRHRSEAELVLFGRATLEIRYFDYQWKTREEAHP